MSENNDKELLAMTCRLSLQSPGFTIYIGKDIADKVKSVLKIGVTHLAVFNPNDETLTIKKMRL